MLVQLLLDAGAAATAVLVLPLPTTTAASSVVRHGARAEAAVPVLVLLQCWLI